MSEEAIMSYLTMLGCSCDAYYVLCTMYRVDLILGHDDACGSLPYMVRPIDPFVDLPDDISLCSDWKAKMRIRGTTYQNVTIEPLRIDVRSQGHTTYHIPRDPPEQVF